MKYTRNILLRFIVSVDSPARASANLGKVRGVSLPQEYDLARLIAEVHMGYTTWTSKTPACSWKGVKCNKDGNVVDIYWSGYDDFMKGFLRWEFIPTTVLHFSVADNELYGPLSIHDLPRALDTFDASYNALQGSIDLSALPPELDTFNVQWNSLSGSIAFAKLPSTLTTLNLSSNRFSGEVEFSSLPKNVAELYLDNNSELSGTVRRNTLPDSLLSRSWTKTQITDNLDA